MFYTLCFISFSFKLLIFFLTPFVGCAVGRYQDSTNLTAQNKSAQAARSLHSTSVTVRLAFSSDPLVYLHGLTFFLPPKAKVIHQIALQKQS
jgi:hypothetical protein